MVHEPLHHIPAIDGFQGIEPHQRQEGLEGPIETVGDVPPPEVVRDPTALDGHDVPLTAQVHLGGRFHHPHRPLHLTVVQRPLQERPGIGPAFLSEGQPQHPPPGLGKAGDKASFQYPAHDGGEPCAQLDQRHGPRGQSSGDGIQVLDPVGHATGWFHWSGPPPLRPIAPAPIGPEAPEPPPFQAEQVQRLLDLAAPQLHEGHLPDRPALVLDPAAFHHPVPQIVQHMIVALQDEEGARPLPLHEVALEGHHQRPAFQLVAVRQGVDAVDDDQRSPSLLLHEFVEPFEIGHPPPDGHGHLPPGKDHLTGSQTLEPSQSGAGMRPHSLPGQGPFGQPGKLSKQGGIRDPGGEIVHLPAVVELVGHLEREGRLSRPGVPTHDQGMPARGLQELDHLGRKHEARWVGHSVSLSAPPTSFVKQLSSPLSILGNQRRMKKD